MTGGLSRAETPNPPPLFLKFENLFQKLKNKLRDKYIHNMNIHPTTIRQYYSVTTINGCTITATKGGKKYTLLTLGANQQGQFQAISDNVEYSDADAVILPLD